MGCDLFSLATSGVQGLSPYLPGKPVTELQRELGLDYIVKLASNENPLGPSGHVLAAIQAASAELTRYPDGNGFELKSALAQHLGVDLASVTLGNGSNDILELIARAFVSPGEEILFSQYAFAVDPIVTQAIGAKAVIVPAGNGQNSTEYGHDLVAMASAITANTRLIFIANPNNPTGTYVTQQQFSTFISSVPENVIVVVDEAYVEYVTVSDYPATIAWLAEYPNLIITRTFSKAYGLAGLRVGYSLSHPDVANILNRVRQPFNVNSLALTAAVAALADTTYLAQSVALNDAGMEQIKRGCGTLGLKMIPSLGNFLTVDMGQPAAPLYQKLLALGVIVRLVDNYGLPNHLRISIGTEEENQFFLKQLSVVLA